MKASTIDTLIWLLIYGGLLIVGLGLSVQRTNDGLGYGVTAVGGVVAAVGFALIYVRSRMKDTPQPIDKTPTNQ
ncbi:MAG: hypothetical protein ABI605_16295 [Rhizobacter sp.]